VTERPYFVKDGKRYLRRSGAWIDAQTQLTVPATLMTTLDKLARADPVLWKRCCEQDWSDAPPRRRRFGLDSEFNLVHRVDPPRRPSPTGGTRPGPARLVHRFSEKRELVLSCEIQSTWRRTETAWRVGESTVIELPRGYALRVSLGISEVQWSQWQRKYYGDWNSFDERERQVDKIVPEFAPGKAELGVVHYQIDGQYCEWRVPLLTPDGELNDAVAWRFRGRSWRFKYGDYRYERPVAVGDKSRTIQRAFQAQLEGVLNPPARPTRAPIVEYDLPLPSAGLPSLGKRR